MYRGAMLNIHKYRLRASSCPDIYRNSMTTIAKENEEVRAVGAVVSVAVVTFAATGPTSLSCRLLSLDVRNYTKLCKI
jgi:hypothetical protein